MSPQIIPAILAKNAREFKRKLTAMVGVASLVQVDVMDGRFVPNKTWYDATTVASWHVDMEFELHLMVEDPFPIMADWMKVRGLRRFIIHAESPIDLKDAIADARTRCIEIGFAISPGTPLKKILPFVKQLDEVQVMGGMPGFSGKSLDVETLKTVRALHRRFPNLPIGFDIGVSAKTVPVLKRAGVTRFCAASAVFGMKDPKAAVARLERAMAR